MNTIDALDTPIPTDGGILIVPKYDEGDFRVEWKPEKSEQVESARRQFVELKAKGYKAYRVDPKSNEKGELIKEFDPAASKIVMIAPFAGG